MQAGNVVVDFSDGWKQGLVRNIRIEVNGLQTLRKASDGVVSIFIIALYMLAGTGNRQDIEKLEIILPQQGKQARCRSFFFRQVEPANEAPLGVCCRCFNAWNTIMSKGIIPISGNKSDLVFKSATRLLTGVADSIRTLVGTPDWMIRFINKLYLEPLCDM